MQATLTLEKKDMLPRMRVKAFAFPGRAVRVKEMDQLPAELTDKESFCVDKATD